MRSENFTPSTEELLQPKKQQPLSYSFEGKKQVGEINSTSPELATVVEDYQKGVEVILEEYFGIKEFPQDIATEMEMISRRIHDLLDKEKFASELPDNIFDRLDNLAVFTANYKLQPKNIEFFGGVGQVGFSNVSEVGETVSFTDKDDVEHKRVLTSKEQDLRFNYQLWAEGLLEAQNARQFKEALTRARESALIKSEGNQEKVTKEIKKKMYRQYEPFKFTREQIDNLILLAEETEISVVSPETRRWIPLPFANREVGLHKLEVMKEVWDDYMTGSERTRYAALAGGIMLTGFAEGFSPFLLRYAIDSKNISEAVLFSAGFFASSATMGLSTGFLYKHFINLTNEIMNRPGGVNERLARDLAFQPGQKMDDKKTRDQILVSIQRSQEAFRGILSETAEVILPNMASVVSSLAMGLLNDWRLGLIAIGVGVSIFSSEKKLEKERVKTSEEIKKQDRKLAGEVEEQLAAHMEITISGAREEMAKKMQSIRTARDEQEVKRNAIAISRYIRVGTILSPLFTSALIASGALLKSLSQTEEMVGRIIAAMMYGRQFQGSFDKFSSSFSRLSESVQNVVEMEETFNGYADEERILDKKRIGVDNLSNFGISVKGVSLDFGDKNVVDNLSFEIPEGSVLRIEGRSGRGKSTVAKLLSGYYAGSKGEISIGGERLENLKKSGSDSFYSRVAYLQQYPYIFESGNLKDNLLFGVENSSDAEMIQVLEELELKDRFLVGQKIDLESKIIGLSGGERRRLALARVLLKIRGNLKKGGIVIVDEPTEGLDPETEEEVVKILVAEKKKNPRLTFIIATHRQGFIDGLVKERDGEVGLKISSIRLEKGRMSESV